MIRSCSKCGQRNRIPAAKLAVPAKCGKCKTSIPALFEPVDVDASEFREILQAARVPVLVDFWAEWCGPCRVAAPAVKAVAKSAKGEALVLKVDTEAQAQLAQQFEIRGIPTFVVFKDGTEVFRQSGVVDSETMHGWLRKAAL